ncbi:hypothetical protein [Undibacterium oligocarboniphilum]|uniref:Lipoprotein n=1 Tax=Undibacterium oligocarboniphilum TaxID=666702 RepID=A0A850QJJ1_9BURK|nr:hypothetical protein [Undibacterium oligocarboniphilum]MBC3871865.1 hypothetical protein [Undibacterium oligocarboniphilum]NVO79428.1 hypothetical protein [Undibacterium oligocarboniphilum]
MFSLVKTLSLLMCFFILSACTKTPNTSLDGKWDCTGDTLLIAGSDVTIYLGGNQNSVLKDKLDYDLSHLGVASENGK